MGEEHEHSLGDKKIGFYSVEGEMGQSQTKSKTNVAELPAAPNRFQVIDDLKEVVKEGNSQFQDGKFTTAQMLYLRSIRKLFNEGVKEGIIDSSKMEDSEMFFHDFLGDVEISHVISYADQLASKVKETTSAVRKTVCDEMETDEEASGGGLMELIDGTKKSADDDLAYLVTYSICAADLLNNTAAVLFLIKQTRSSLQLNYKVLRLRGLIHGGNSIAAAESLQNISSCLDALSDLEAAERKLLKAIELENLHGLDGTVESTSMLNNLSVLYSHMGRYDEAETTLLSVLKHREEKLGKNHRLTQNALANLEAIRAARVSSVEETASGEDAQEEGAPSPFPASLLDDVESSSLVGSAEKKDEEPMRLESHEG